jgi:hypothetical protein
VSNPVLICYRCGWKVDKGLTHLVKQLDEWIPPCSVCNGILEGYRILND